MTENERNNLKLEGFQGTYTIYAHVNKINNKTYVGQTKVDPLRRWHGGNGYFRNEYFYHSIQKYDWNEGFNHYILLDNISVDLADIIEIELIKKFDLMNPKNGYNHHPGGHHEPLTPEQIEKIRKASTGRPCSEETRQKIRESRIGEKNPNYGKHRSQETIEKTRQKLKGRKMSPEKLEKHIQASINARGYKVLQYDMFGMYITSYGSTGDAARKNNISISGVKNSCNHILKNYSGYIWLYEKEGYVEEENLPKDIVLQHRSRKTILQYTKDNIFVKEYLSLAEAQNQTGVDRHGISKTCKNLQESCGGYIWKYA